MKATRSAPLAKLVVVIDDDPLILEATEGLLRSWGCRVVAARSCDEALVRLAETEAGRRPDVIVCDYQLSRGVTGVDAIERLRSAFPIPALIPALLISGDASSPRCEVGSRGIPPFVQAGESGQVSRGVGRRLRAATVGSGNPTDGRQELAAGIGPASAPEANSRAVGSRMANQMARLEGVASGWPGIEIMNPKFMWSRPPRIRGSPEPGAKLVMGARRKGRPPLGSQAMSGAERTRRYRQRLAELGKPSKASER